MMDTPMSLMNERVSELCDLIGAVRQEVTGIRLEMSEMKADLATVKTDVAWLKKFFWVPVAAACTALTGAVVSVLLKCN